MLWVPLILASAVALVWAVLHRWQQKQQIRHAVMYHAKYQQLVAQLDTITQAVNQFAPLARDTRDHLILDYYETLLQMMETLLAAVTKLPPFGTNPSTLNAAFYLVKDCRHRAGQLHQAFQDKFRGRKVQLNAPRPGKSGKPTNPVAALTQGCYFCSRPLIRTQSAKVKVRIDQSIKEVMACSVCKEELAQTKKVKVLYFMKSGQPVHWSKVADYKPSEDYWNINKRQPIRKTRQLELIYSSASQPDHPLH